MDKTKLHLTIELDEELIETIVEAVVKELSEESEVNTTEEEIDVKVFNDRKNAPDRFKEKPKSLDEVEELVTQNEAERLPDNVEKVMVEINKELRELFEKQNRELKAYKETVEWFEEQYFL